MPDAVLTPAPLSTTIESVPDRKFASDWLFDIIRSLQHRRFAGVKRGNRRGSAEARSFGKAASRALLACAYINQAHAGQRPYEEGVELASEEADAALRIDPDLPLAHASRAWIAMAYERDYAASARHFRHARALAPYNPVVLTNNAVLAIKPGRLDDA